MSKAPALESGSTPTQPAAPAPSRGLRSLITNASYTPQQGPTTSPGDFSPPSAQLLGELVRDLPEDAGKWHTVVVTDESVESQRLKYDFANHPELRKLLEQTHHTAYTPADPMFRDRYRAYVGEGFPQVWLLKPDGKRVYKASGKGPQGVPVGDQLAAEIAAAIAADCPNCPVRPNPPYQPGPHVTPSPSTPQDQFVPDLRPQPDGLAEPAGNAGMLIFAAAVIGLAVLVVLGAMLVSILPQSHSESGP